MLAFLMTIADEQYRSQIDRLYKRYHQKMLRMATNAFSAAKRNNPGLDAEDAVQSTFLCIVRYVIGTLLAWGAEALVKAVKKYRIQVVKNN